MSDNEPRSGTTRIDRADPLSPDDRRAIERRAIEAGRREQRDREIMEAEGSALRQQQEAARRTPEEERRDARAKAPGHVLLLLLILLLAYLVAAATGRQDIISFPRSYDAAGQGGLPPLEGSSSLGSAAASNAASGVARGTGGVGAEHPVAPIFNDYYIQRNGPRVFGKPLSDVVQVEGRTSQWFERARLEYWPEHNGTQYQIQPGLVGVEFTHGLPFPNQGFFVSNPQLVYAPLTNHGVSQRFYSFWAQNGGLDTFGYPISDELQELLPTTGQVHTVQYFERGRLEFHPEHAGTENEIMIGLLGRALFFNDSAPQIVSAAKPTPVPVPAQ